VKARAHKAERNSARSKGKGRGSTVPGSWCRCETRALAFGIPSETNLSKVRCFARTVKVLDANWRVEVKFSEMRSEAVKSNPTLCAHSAQRMGHPRVSVGSPSHHDRRCRRWS
jgi:hypothetical protein